MLRLFYCLMITLTMITPLTGYDYNPYVGKDIWESVKPYFLPDDHPIKAKLDSIFKNRRVTHNTNTLLQAKFRHLKESKWSHVVCAKHPKLKGYVVKVYLDEGPDIPDWARWIDRIRGAEAVRQAIHKHHGYQEMFKVAKKWIYPLPAEPAPKDIASRKNFILIVEDMHVHRRKDSLKKWKGVAITAKKLNALFVMLRDLGLADCVYAFNLPFCKDGRIVFVDTEHHHEWPVHYHRLHPYLSPKMKLHWKDLTKRNGP